ncbi:sigma-70 family RNA polymerase sigma factor [Lysobacter sp. D1-1-M9]|uniref:RNA polymerase sigma factor n=1 Tax=Novilysobacter longmucuonensis TaxID=3098603 RepID=UPI002FCCAF39
MAEVLPFARTEPAAPMHSEPTQAVTSDRDAAQSGADAWGELMLQAQDGDRSAYRALLLSVTPYLRAIAHRYLGRGDDADDALQDILLIVHGIRHTYELGRPFKPWLATIASRRCIDLLRRRTQRLRHEVESSDGLLPEPADRMHGPDEAVSGQHTAQTLRQAVDALPARPREAVRRLRLDELSLNEAVERTEQSIGSLKVACHRALKSLRRTLEPRDRPYE